MEGAYAIDSGTFCRAKHEMSADLRQKRWLRRCPFSLESAILRCLAEMPSFGELVIENLEADAIQMSALMFWESLSSKFRGCKVITESNLYVARKLSVIALVKRELLELTLLVGEPSKTPETGRIRFPFGLSNTELIVFELTLWALTLSSWHSSSVSLHLSLLFVCSVVELTDFL